MSDISQILLQIESGDPSAAEELLPIVYQDLKRLAATWLARELPGQTLQVTALVHDAYVRLVDQQRVQHWNSRGHFFSAAAEAMRRIIVEHARHRSRLKRGGDHKRIDLDTGCTIQEPPSLDMLALDEALSKLAALDGPKAELVKLRFFAGLTMPQAADALGVSLATAERYWVFAKAWLHSELSDEVNDFKSS